MVKCKYLPSSPFDFFLELLSNEAFIILLLAAAFFSNATLTSSMVFSSCKEKSCFNFLVKCPEYWLELARYYTLQVGFIPMHLFLNYKREQIGWLILIVPKKNCLPYLKRCLEHLARSCSYENSLNCLS